jgi:hypothetical protein
VRFLLGCLEDLSGSLRRLGGDLLLRRGDWVGEAIRVATATDARAIHLAEDASGYAAARRRRLAAECERHRLRLATFPASPSCRPASCGPPAATTTGCSRRTGGPGATRAGASRPGPRRGCGCRTGHGQRRWQPAAVEPRDEQRRFETLWTLDAAATRRAALAVVPLATRRDQALGEGLAAVLDRRPLAFQAPVPALTALANRAVAYVEASRLPPAGT